MRRRKGAAGLRPGPPQPGWLLPPSLGGTGQSKAGSPAGEASGGVSPWPPLRPESSRGSPVCCAARQLVSLLAERGIFGCWAALQSNHGHIPGLLMYPASSVVRRPDLLPQTGRACHHHTQLWASLEGGGSLPAPSCRRLQDTCPVSGRPAAQVGVWRPVLVAELRELRMLES